MRIYNISNQLDRHANRKWGYRSLSKINKIILHQSLSEGSIENINNYHINPNHISENGCPRICYHYGIRKNGEILQLNNLHDITWHTKRQNTVAIGVLIAGNFNGSGYQLGGSPTTQQMHAITEFIPYLMKNHNLIPTDIYGHYHFGKPACPGEDIQNWIEDFRNSDNNNTINELPKSILEIQKRLNELNYNAGPEDGIRGSKTNTAIRKFQKDHALVADGIVGRKTWRVMMFARPHPQSFS